MIKCREKTKPITIIKKNSRLLEWTNEYHGGHFCIFPKYFCLTNIMVQVYVFPCFIFFFVLFGHFCSFVCFRSNFRFLKNDSFEHFFNFYLFNPHPFFESFFNNFAITFPNKTTNFKANLFKLLHFPTNALHFKCMKGNQKWPSVLNTRPLLRVFFLRT